MRLRGGPRLLVLARGERSGRVLSSRWLRGARQSITKMHRAHAYHGVQIGTPHSKRNTRLRWALLSTKRLASPFPAFITT